MATPPSGIRHCRPDCRPCEAVERLGVLAAVLEQEGRTDLADAVYAIGDHAGQKNPLGARLVAAVLDDTSGRTRT